MAIKYNMHIDVRLAAVADFKSKVKFYIWVYWGHAEVNLILIDVSLPNRSEVYRASAHLFLSWDEIGAVH